MIEADIPCGRCSMGIYAYAAATTPEAIAMLDAADSGRDAMVPRCKKHDRACVGACDFLSAVREDGGFVAEVRAAAAYVHTHKTGEAHLVPIQVADIK